MYGLNLPIKISVVFLLPKFESTMKKIIIPALFIFLSIPAFADIDYIDSLKHELWKKHDGKKEYVNLLNQIGYSYLYINPDSALSYSKMAYRLASEFGYPGEMARAMNNMGVVLNNRGLYGRSQAYYDSALVLYYQIKDSLGIAHSYNNLGLLKKNQGEYTESMQYFYKASGFYEKIGYIEGQATVHINIGVVYYHQGNIERAIEYHKNALELQKKRGDSRELAVNIRNIGSLYSLLGDDQQALDYYLEALSIEKRIDNSQGIAIIYNNIGELYAHRNDFENALNYFNKSYDIKSKNKNQRGMAHTLNNIALSYYKLGNLAEMQNVFDQAISISKEIGFIENLEVLYFQLAGIHKEQSNYKRALNYYESYLEIKDSLTKQKNNKALLEMQARFETEKKEKEIELLKKEKALQYLEIKRKKLANTLFLVGLSAVFLVGLLLYFAYRQKKRSNIKLRQKNDQIAMQNEEILSQRDNLEQLNHELIQQKEEITAQRDEIEHKNVILEEAYQTIENKNRNITDSIQYARVIQSIILPSSTKLKSIFPQSFVFYQPKDIVSGDFYWAETDDHELFFSAVDCTGHGVPGAFVSIFAYNLLNKAFKEKGLRAPGEILNLISKELYAAISQSEQFHQIKAGMDLTLIRVSLKEKIMYYSGVHLPLLIVRGKDIIKLKTHIHPIGMEREDEGSYQTHVFELKEGDQIYLFSDGFVDQFGEKTRRKFMMKRFREFILKNSSFSLETQGKLMEQTFFDWKGNVEQMDDVLVAGIRVC